MTLPIDQILDTLTRVKRVLLTTHVRPDGDALGSTAALQLGLRSRGIEAPILLLSKLPSKYAFVFEENGIDYRVAGETIEPTLLDKFDALIVVDTGTWSQLPGLQAIVSSWNKPRLVIDHHRTQESWADVLWQDIDAAAAGEMIETLLVKGNIELTPSISNCLFVAIASDTGWMQFSNTTPRTMRLVAQLMEHGVDTDAMYQRLYQNERVERLLLQQRAIGSMRFDGDGRVASMLIRAADFAASGAGVPDTENLVNFPLQVARVAASLVFTESPEGGPIRISFRSKGAVDVSKFAERFGGGGHARAAGAKVDGEIEAVRERVVGELIETLKTSF